MKKEKKSRIIETKMREPARLGETCWFEVDLACKGCVSNDRVKSVVA